MKLLTEVELPIFEQKISYAQKLFFIGSCFSNEISQQFLYLGYTLCANPFGTVYNSRAILRQIKSIVNEDDDFNSYIVESNEEYVSLLHNTAFRHQEKEQLLQKIHRNKKEAKQYLSTADVVFITLGTAMVYELKSSKKIVANCQKLPAHSFTRYSLSTNEVIEDLKGIEQILNRYNPTCKIILTISPIRHKKDGFIKNQLSKSILVQAVHEYIQLSNNNYFPSYEIVLDELRDYRFYTDDLIHLNSLGIQYVWEKVCKSLINPDDYHVHKQVKKFRKFEQHQSSNPEHLNEVEKERKKLNHLFKLNLT